ncbi:LuxR C-terminal-related transcriptional regulator [Variovorax sp. DAIF25]|uniref:LuxR C-terminal-related transcriptional regulator n=1 Tax=Variovorax sp. DAIF25 TaxID=3080983 RepID=UPI003D6BCF32
MTHASRLFIQVRHEDPLVLAGLVSLIGQQLDFEVRPDGTAADVIVADHACALALLAAAGGARGPRVVVMTRRDKEGEVMAAIRAGAHGYLLQDASPQELMDCIRHVARGGSRYLCRRTAGLLESGPPRTGLTAREEDVLRFLVKGDCNKGIARKLDISANTVKAHVSRICEKLHVSSRAQVAVKATQRGLVRA